MRFFQNGRCYPFLLLSWWPWRRPWVSIYQGQGFAFNKRPLQTNDFQVPSLTACLKCLDFVYPNIFKTYHASTNLGFQGESLRASISFSLLFWTQEVTVNFRTHCAAKVEEALVHWCKSDSSVWKFFWGFQVLHCATPTGMILSSAFWGWPSRLWARKSMLKCSTVDLYWLWLYCDRFLTALKFENWYVDICELWLELWPCFDPSALHFKFQVSIPSIETSTATRCRMIKASPFGLFGRISPATSMRVAWSRKGVSGCVSSGDVVQNITLHDMRTAEQERYDFHIPILCALSKHRPSQNPSQNVQ